MMYRLPVVAGEWIDRSRRLAFTFENRTVEAFEGDTITSALAAAGVMMVGRSFKYHRPRGLLSFANHDSNAMFQVGYMPNVRGDVELARDGMQVAAVNTFGSLQHDRGRWLNHLSRFLPVGFYYKAFHSKHGFPWWEGVFRKLTGLGTVDFATPRQSTRKRYGFCDVAVIGGGVSGMSAALAAADAGAQVMLVEESMRLGGCGLWGDTAEHGRRHQTGELVSRVQSHPHIDVLRSAFVAGCYADHWLAVAEADRLTKVRAQAVVVAGGAVEQPAVFRNNDLPGVLLGSAAQRLLYRHGVAVGRRVLILGANREAYELALDLGAQGLTVSGIVDMRAHVEDRDLERELQKSGVKIYERHAVYEAHASADGSIGAATLVPLKAGGVPDIDAQQRVDCDALLMSVGWAPSVSLLRQAGAQFEFHEGLQQYVPTRLPAGIFAAGRVNGVFGSNEKIADGMRAGQLAARHAGFVVPEPGVVARASRQPSFATAILAHPKGKNFVDFDEDLQVADLQNAIQEGFDSVELMKRYSTVGMGPSQGKHSNMNAVRVLAAARGTDVQSAGVTTARPLYHPVPLKLLAGRSFTPERVTPVDRRHEDLGAVWMPAGNWRRPEYYARPGLTREQCIEQEVQAVRSGVGLIDVGTLGKIEIHGPQAGEFLERVYTGRFADMKVGATRYALMLDEAGTIVDDGVVARLTTSCFYFTTTTGGSATVFRELLRWNALWGMDCALVNVTGHRAAFNLAGPASRRVLGALTALPLDAEAFPYQAAREGEVAGVPARLLRVGFVGELGYEIHVPFGLAAHVWDALTEAGRAHGIRPFGVEAQRVLRLEKGHFIVGQDTDGLTNPIEAQASWAVKMRRPFFVGQRSLRILEQRGPRQKLVGFELDDVHGAMPRECHLVIDGEQIAGRVTSVARSTTLGKVIGLAMVSPALSEPGQRIAIRAGHGHMVHGTVVATPFYDPRGERQKLPETE